MNIGCTTNTLYGVTSVILLAIMMSAMLIGITSTIMLSFAVAQYFKKKIALIKYQVHDKE